MPDAPIAPSRCASAGRPAVLGSSVIAVVGLALVAFAPTSVEAQRKAARADKAGPAVERGFGIGYDDRLADLLTKFEEHVQGRAWDKAFRILADVPDEKWTSMLPDRHGFVRPASNRVREVVLQLPADGREAYRLFFDAKARLLFSTAKSAEKEDDVRIARSIYDRYFITSVGDDAADRLADDCFERGQFAEAADYWKSILDFHPDTNLPEAKLVAKRALALFRAGKKGDFARSIEQLERRFPAAKVALGGQEVDAAAFLKSLDGESDPPRHSAAGPAAEDESCSGLAPHDEARPAWQQRFLDPKDWAGVEAQVRSYYGSQNLPVVIPSAAADGMRVYCNWFGACFAIDGASGKIVWSSTELNHVVSRLRVNNGRSALLTSNTSQFALRVGKGLVLCTSPSPRQDNCFHLAAYDATNGQTRWTSDGGPAREGRSSFLGTPVIDGDSVYAVTHQVGASNELVLRQLALKTGALVWSLRLGTPQLVGDPDWGQQFLPIPSLLVSGSRLYILTNDGALLAVNLGRRQIEWIFKYAPPPTAGNGQRFFRSGGDGARHALPSEPLFVRDGVIYFKESSSPTLYALEEDGPRIKWKWNDSEFANLVGVDDRDVYLFSNELSAIPRDKPAVRWSSTLPADLQGLGVKVGSRGILVFNSRGLFEISKETGDTRSIFRGADLGAVGGKVLSVGNKLVCVSNLAVTGYLDRTPR